MAQNDIDDVRLHATQTFAAVGRKFNQLSRPKRLVIKGVLVFLIFICGYVTCDIVNSVPTEGVIEKIAALPDAKNNANSATTAPWNTPLCTNVFLQKEYQATEQNSFSA